MKEVIDDYLLGSLCVCVCVGVLKYCFYMKFFIIYSPIGDTVIVITLASAKRHAHGVCY